MAAGFTGLFPRLGGAPGRSRRLSTPLTFSGVPMIDRDRWRDVFTAFLEAVGKRSVLFRDGAVRWPILGHAVRCGATRSTARRGARPMGARRLRPTGSFEDWFDSNFERKRRKEYRRLRSRLAEMGKLEFFSWEPGEELDPWIGDLMALEAKGWKGRRGTALAQDPAMAVPWRGAQPARGRGQLRFWMTRAQRQADRHDVGHRCRAGKAWLGKIAYDEAFAKYSPGVHAHPRCHRRLSSPKSGIGACRFLCHS